MGSQGSAASAQEVNRFWLNEIGPKGWYNSSDDLDDAIRTQFMALWEQALNGKLSHWAQTPEDMLALLILTDQFPRNMFRGDARSFATDPLACKLCYDAIARGLDQQIGAPERQFFYMPLMHSENLSDQDLSVRCFEEKMGGDNGNILHARVHREVIQDFGRFPYRNDALGRVSTPQEIAFLEQGGYGFALRRYQGHTT